MRRALEIAFVAAVACLVFGRAVGYGFVNCDDYDYALKYAEVAGGLTASGVRWAFANVSEAIWMPLTWLSYMADYDVARLAGLFDASVDGLGVAGVMHAHSVLLHAANAVLAFLLYLRLARSAAAGGGGVPPAVAALVAALLWALHPLRVESVAWVSARKDVLSLFWELLAFHAWLGVKPGAGRSVRWYLLSAACFAAAACAKPSAMTFPLLAMVLDRFVLRRWAGWSAYAPLLAVGAAVGVLAAWAQGAGGATRALSGVPFWWRGLNAMAAFGIYAWHEVWPSGLAVQCLARWPEMPRFLLPGVCVSLVAAWYLVANRGRFLPGGAGRAGDMPFAAALWCCVAVAPFLGLANFGIHAFADRFTYVPSLGIGLAVVWALRGAGTRPRARRLASAAGLLLCACYGAAAWRQTGFWSDDGALYARTLEADGWGNGEAHVSLGTWAWEFPHDLPLAIRHLRAGWEADAARAGRVGHLLVMALCERGELEEAEESLSRLREWGERQAERHRRTAGGHARTTLNYHVARAYYLSCRDVTRRDADEICGCLEEIRPSHPDVLYLRLRLAGLSGDAEAEREARRKLSALTGEYVHHRFVNRQEGRGASGGRAREEKT